MMRYDWDYQMMDGFGPFMFLIWLVIFTDLVLLGIWLWQRINKK